MGKERGALLADVGSSNAVGRPGATRRGAMWVTPPVVVVALAAFCVLCYLALLLDDSTTTWLIREEHPIEGAGALGLLAAAIACVVLWRRVAGDPRWPWLRRLSLLVLAALFAFGFGEEISWGQRIFGIGTPEALETANRQEELNVHNLEALGGAFDPDRLFQLFWLVLGVIVPLAALWRPAHRLLQRAVPVLPLALAPLFVLNQLLTRGFTELFANDASLYKSSVFPPDHATFEVKETVATVLLAAGFWLLVRGWRRQPDARAR
jgi:hypothetical protein